jgi:hypothetical protein
MLAARSLTDPSASEFVSDILSPDKMRTLFQHEDLLPEDLLQPPSLKPHRCPLLVFPRPKLSIGEMERHFADTKLDVEMKIDAPLGSEAYRWYTGGGDEGWSVAETRKENLGAGAFVRVGNARLNLRDPSWRLPSAHEAVTLFAALAQKKHPLTLVDEILITYVAERMSNGDFLRVRMFRRQIDFLRVRTDMFDRYHHVIRFKRLAADN